MTKRLKKNEYYLATDPNPPDEDEKEKWPPTVCLFTGKPKLRYDTGMNHNKIWAEQGSGYCYVVEDEVHFHDLKMLLLKLAPKPGGLVKVKITAEITEEVVSGD